MTSTVHPLCCPSLRSFLISLTDKLFLRLRSCLVPIAWVLFQRILYMFSLSHQSCFCYSVSVRMLNDVTKRYNSTTHSFVPVDNCICSCACGNVIMQFNIKYLYSIYFSSLCFLDDIVIQPYTDTLYDAWSGLKPQTNHSYCTLELPWEYNRGQKSLLENWVQGT